MTSYLHYNQGEMHFFAEDLLIAWQCQSLHEDVEADRMWQVFLFFCIRAERERERTGCGRQSKQPEKKGNNPFCTLSNNYSNMKIITVEATRLYHETNMSCAVIQFMLPVKIITHSDYAQWRWDNPALLRGRCADFKLPVFLQHGTNVWGFSRNYFHAY